MALTSKTSVRGGESFGLSINGLGFQGSVPVSTAPVVRSPPRLLPPVSPVRHPHFLSQPKGPLQQRKGRTSKEKPEDTHLDVQCKAAGSIQRFVGHLSDFLSPRPFLPVPPSISTAYGVRLIRGAIDRAYARKLSCLRLMTASDGRVTPRGSIPVLVLFSCSSVLERCVNILTSCFAATIITSLSFRGYVVSSSFVSERSMDVSVIFCCSCTALLPESVRIIANHCPSLVDLDLSFAALCGEVF